MPAISFMAIVAGSTAVDALLCGLVVLRVASRAQRAGDRALGLRHIAPAACATSLAIAAKLLVLRGLGLSDFGVVHLVYIDLTALFPAVAFVLLARSGSTPQRWVTWTLTAPARAVAAAALALIPVGLYASWIEPFRLQVESRPVAVPARRHGRERVRIGVLSDLQTSRVTAYERNAVARLMAQAPDIIVLPGDVFQGSAADFDATRYDLKDLLECLSAPGGVYLVLGDTDGDGGHLDEILRSSQVRILRNEIIHATVRDRRVTIGGVGLRVESTAAREVIEQLEQTPGDDDLRVIVAHRPDVVFELSAGSRIDLVIAGHTHGGQVVVPGYGPPLTLTRVPRDVAAGGLHRLRGNPIYVSRGVGCERGEAPRIRFLCPPEVSLLILGDRAGP